MAGTSDIAIIGLVALMLSDKLGGLNLGGLLGKTDRDPQVEIKTTESISCRCSDGFKMQSDSGNCIQECESLGHGTKETRTETVTIIPGGEPKITETRTESENITMRTVCNTTGEIIDLTNVPNDQWAQVISDRCGYDCPEPYEFMNGVCRLPTAAPIYIPTTPAQPGRAYEEISGGRTWRDSPELQAVQAPAFLETTVVTPPHEPPTISAPGLSEIYRPVFTAYTGPGSDPRTTANIHSYERVYPRSDDY